MSDPNESQICAGCIAAFTAPAMFLDGTDYDGGRRRVESIEAALHLDMTELTGPQGERFAMYARTTIEGTAFCLDCARRVLEHSQQPQRTRLAPWQMP